MTHKESLLSPTAIFYYFIMLMWPWISLERENYFIWSLRKSSKQCHNSPVLVPTSKPPDPVKDFNVGHTYDLKTSMNVWTRIYAVPVEYGIFAYIFHLTMWLFQFITRFTFKLDYVMWHIIALLMWIGIWMKLRIYKVPPDPVRWSCQGFGSLWRTLMLVWLLWYKNELKVSHRKQVNAPSNMKLVTSLMNFECHPCRILKFYHTINNIKPLILLSFQLLYGWDT